MKKIIITTMAVLAMLIVLPTSARATYDYGYEYDYDYTVEECVPTDFTADMYTLESGQSTVLHWDSIGCDEAAIHPAAYPGDRPPYGSVATGAIMDTTVFALTVYDVDGNIGGQRFLTIKITDGDDDDNGSDCRIDDFDADDTSIEEGDETDLRWSTTGCDEVKINQGIGEVDLDGSEEVDPSNTTTYTLSAYDNGRLEDTDTVRITVDGDDDNGGSCSIDEFKADDTSIESGDSVVLRWKTTGADSVDLSPGYSNRSDDGSVTVNPTRTTTYTLDVDCRKGADRTRSITVSVDRETSSSPQAITTVAAILSSTSAQLNGIAYPNTNSGTTTAWFEWGPTTNLGYKTAVQTVPTNTNANYYNAPVNGLVPGTIYYYRAVVKNQNGTVNGDIAKFQTRATTTTTTPTTTVVRTQVVRDVVVAQSAPSLLEVQVESTFDRMCINGTIEYTVTYRNVSSITLEEAVLQVTHQKEVSLINSSRGDYDVVDRTITVDLGTLSPGETGTVFVRGKVNDLAVSGNLTVMTVQMVYTNTQTRAQESAIAYSLVNISDDCPNGLVAGAFGFWSFLPDTLLEWLLLILVILALIVLGRQLYKKKQPESQM